MFIFGAMIAYGVQIIPGSSDNQYDLKVKGQGHIYLKAVKICLTARNANSFIFFYLGCTYLVH